jgi:Yip1-like protein
VTETAALTAPETVSGKGLGARLAGVVFSPRATFADVAARPRVFGALLVTLVLITLPSVAFLSTDVGKAALLDQQERMMDNLGFRVPDAQYELMRERVQGPMTPVFTAAGDVVFIPFLAVVVAGLLIAVFNAVMGGNATFKQVLAIVVHSQFLSAFQALFMFPIDYAKQTMSSPTTLAVFMPFLDEGTFFARLMGSIDLFRIWWIVNLAIGMGVIYKRRTGPIATTMLVLYAVIALCIAAIGVAFSGA